MNYVGPSLGINIGLEIAIMNNINKRLSTRWSFNYELYEKKNPQTVMRKDNKTNDENQ